MSNEDHKDATEPKGKQKKTPEAIRAGIEAQLHNQKMKDVEGKARKIVEAITSTRALLVSQEAELAQLWEDNPDLFPEYATK